MSEASPSLPFANLLDGDPVRYRATIAPNRIACVELASGRRTTYAELDASIDALRQTIPPGTRLAWLGRNSIDGIAMAMACHRFGATFVPLNWRLTVAELNPILENAGPVLVVADDEFRWTAEQAAHPLAIPVFSELPPAVAMPAANPTEVCTLLYTSGTTGRPKGVIVTRQNALFASLNFALVGNLGPDVVTLLDLPMFHTIGLVAVARTTLTLGGTLVISDRFQPERTLSALGDSELGVSHYFCVPQMAVALRHSAGFDAGRLGSVRAIFVGGAPLPKPLIDAWLADGIPLVNGFGMSEAGTVIHVPVDESAVRAHPGSIGLPAPLQELRLVDPEGRDVADGTPGELWLRGPAVSPGYWNDPGATAAAFVGGWYRTGDLLVREPTGYFRLVDRLKDMYISGGENVYPAEVEAVLLGHVDVADVAVVGVPDDAWGEVGFAHVVLREGATASEADLLAHCEARLARFKRPRRIVLGSSIPRTASGKALKQVLRAQHSNPATEVDHA